MAKSKCEKAASESADKYYAGEQYLIAEDSFIKGAEALVRYAKRNKGQRKGGYLDSLQDTISISVLEEWVKGEKQ